MLILTTPSIEGATITAYHGIVSGEAIFYPHTDFNLKEELRKARALAIEEMTTQASHMGANAVVGVDLDYETFGDRASYFMVSASGTAVTYGA